MDAERPYGAELMESGGRDLKVLIIMPLAEQRGGSEVALLQLLKSGQGLGVRWSVIFLEDGPMVADAAACGVQSRVVPAGRLRQPHHMLAAVLKIARILSREKFDLVFSWMTKAHLYGGPAGMLARVPAMWFQLGLPDPRMARPLRNSHSRPGHPRMLARHCRGPDGSQSRQAGQSGASGRGGFPL